MKALTKECEGIPVNNREVSMKLLIENFKNFLNEDTDLSVLYHGSPTSFDFKEFDLEVGVGAIYLFLDKDPAKAFAE